ncbi:MAG TPA: 2-oxoacid:acceptor oxidoreductase family protein [Bacillota bacterium]|nr:2-oxoacid:acceptor oxidoreductase family protein [Bacillota bacterium]HOH10478.1 2-oxoacid:acceptor oxidoreductase family protein [Bacillota bacterium]HOS51118.1 2-oxoacid:acceptor oxidoreductase family protein [Bacillota bacterium]HPI01094.1 2-oxoacid:acceptor oxidoreductase family protein [Bacillota bacterium]HPM63191.1 2-oxoacid:acceptor oxidoreductase family protein [Bacillota bacterium]
MRKELRLSGSGGQGLITAGIILAEAAMRDGLEAVQTQSYGPEARGGAAKAEVILSDAEVDYPKVTSPDYILAMTPIACDRYGCNIKPGAKLVVDEDLVPNAPDSKHCYKFPITKISKEITGRPLSANIVALGVLNELFKFVSPERLEEAVRQRVPKASVEDNVRALNEGIRYTREKMQDK